MPSDKPPFVVIEPLLVTVTVPPTPPPDSPPPKNMVDPAKGDPDKTSARALTPPPPPIDCILIPSDMSATVEILDPLLIVTSPPSPGEVEKPPKDTLPADPAVKVV